MLMVYRFIDNPLIYCFCHFVFLEFESSKFELHLNGIHDCPFYVVSFIKLIIE